jgi:hypothetical protein
VTASALCPSCDRPATVQRTLLGGYVEVRCLDDGTALTRLRVSPLREEASGDDLRDAGIAAVLASTDLEWRVAAERQLEDLARSGERFTSEDLTRVVGVPPSPNAVGAVVNGAARRGLIRPVGFTNATRPSQHSATLRVWEGVR